MRLQHMAVIFVVIFLPIILVTAYFISLQVDTIKLQESYDIKLLDATYDAMAAFELNTANEDLASVADSLRSIIDASNNIFFNTLATNMGVSNASKAYVQPFIPAMLYTLYDGYYIYSPTNTPEVCTDKYGQTISTDMIGVTLDRVITLASGKKIGIYKFNQEALKYEEGSTTAVYNNDKGFNATNALVNYEQLRSSGIQEEYGQLLYKNIDGTYSTVLHTITGDPNKSTYYKQSYILKSFISYSATYVNSDVNVTVNYTLDNFINIQGKIKDVYYSKSGYFISNDLISEIVVDGRTISSWTEYSQEHFDELIINPNEHEVRITLNNGGGSTTTISNRDGSYQKDGVTRYWEDSQNAVKYYIDSWIFSSWVRENLRDVKASDIINNDYSIFNVGKDGTSDILTNINKGTSLLNKMFHVFENDTTIYPFREATATYKNDPENAESAFALHRRNVIKNSITYNLSLSMIVYTEWTKTTEFSMPIMSEEEWDKIMSNVSIVTFMQGFQCGLKTYNNYAIVSSNNNEITVTPNEIYYIPRILVDDPANQNDTLARIDYTREELNSGSALISTAHRIDCPELEDDNSYISFKSKEIKYDKVYDKATTKYVYDHMVYTDYNCIVDSNYIIEDSSGKKFDGNTDVLKYLIEGGEQTKGKLKAYRIAVAKERNNLYKSVAFSDNYGYQVLNNDGGTLVRASAGVNRINLQSFSGGSYNKTNSPDISHISKIEIVLEGTTSRLGTYTSTMDVYLNDSFKYNSPQTIPTTSNTMRTIEYNQDFISSAELDHINITLNNDASTTIKSIKIYYK